MLMNNQLSSFLLSPLNSPPKVHTCKPQLILSLIGLPAQLPQISNPSLFMPSNAIITPTSSPRNLGSIFDSTLSLSDHISAVSKSCFLSIRDLRRIRNTLDHTTAHIYPANKPIMNPLKSQECRHAGPIWGTPQGPCGFCPR